MIDQRGIIVECGDCGRKNRILFAHLAETGRCGNCKADLPPIATPIEIDSESEFVSLINLSPIPVIVDYWAPWCGPCRTVAPEIEKVARSGRGRFLLAKVNTDELPVIAQRYGIRSIPTMIVFSGGREVSRTLGAQPAPAIEAFIRNAVVT